MSDTAAGGRHLGWIYHRKENTTSEPELYGKRPLSWEIIMILVFIDMGIKCCNFSEQGSVTWSGERGERFYKGGDAWTESWGPGGHGAGFRGDSKVECVNAQSLSCVQLFATSWTVAHQAPLLMGFPRQEHWSGLPFPSPGDLPDPGTEPPSSSSPALARVFTTSPPGKP